MILLLVLATALISGLILVGWIPLDRLPDLAGVPPRMALFVALGALVLAVLAFAGRAERR
jgi:hypothetical protein